jgi:hypothetical protein
MWRVCKVFLSLGEEYETIRGTGCSKQQVRIS